MRTADLKKVIHSDQPAYGNVGVKLAFHWLWSTGTSETLYISNFSGGGGKFFISALRVLWYDECPLFPADVLLLLRDSARSLMSWCFVLPCV